MSKRLFLLIALIFIPFILRGEAVVCIHGLVSTSKDMSSVRYSLALTGFEIHMWEYPSTKKFFHEHAFSLCDALTRIAECHPGEPIHFVTHSSGGLVLRAALNMPQCPNEAKIGRAVLFAPPNQGSQLGRKWRYFLPLRIIIGCKSGLELQIYDPYTMSCHFGCFPPSMQVLVIAGTKGNTFLKRPNDGFLTLEETYLETPYYLLTYPVTHGDLLIWTPALRQMTNFLEYGCGL